MTDAFDTVRDLLSRRSSCRGFRPEPAPEALVDRVLAAAQRTASWCNSQPWQVVITRGRATEKFRAALHAHAASGCAGEPDFPFPREYRGVYLDRRRDAGFRLYEAAGIGRGDIAERTAQTLENFRFFGAPHVAIVTSDEALGVYGAVDCGAYVANFLLAAEAAGLSAIPQAALALHAGFIRRYFDLGEDRRIVCGISFGFGDSAHPVHAVRTGRAEVSEVVRWVG